MNINQQKVLLITTMLIVGMTLYPPFVSITRVQTFNNGYSWIFNGHGTVNTSLLLIQIFVTLFAGSVLYFLLDKSNNIFSNYFGNTFNSKKTIQSEENDCELFHGGNGLSKNSPVSINCASMELAKSYMDVFIKDNCGDECKRTDLEYTIKNPNDSSKHIKVVPVKTPNGTTTEFFFDLSRQVNNFTNIVRMFGDKD